MPITECEVDSYLLMVGETDGPRILKWTLAACIDADRARSL